MKKIILTGGGTAGHVTPHLALLPELKNNYEIHYIGSKNGIEKDIIKNYPFVTYHSITCAKLIRSFNIKNFAIPFKLLSGYFQSKKLIKKIKPNVVFSKGGFVAVPVVFASSKLRVPVISHESDLSMGLANKLVLNKVKTMCTTFRKTAQTYKNCTYTGSPIRDELFAGNKEIALKKCNFVNENKPTIMIMGGSLGAKAINKVVVESLDELLKHYNIIHLTGKGNLSGIKKHGYYEVEFVTDIQHYYALADIIVSRAGSNSITEFLALKKPMLLIPLPTHSSRGDQIENAKEFEINNYALTLHQEKLNTDTLINSINKLQKNKENIIKAQENSGVKNAKNEIINLIYKHTT